MRAMGPGSVSSLLKIALDVVFFALWAVIGLLVLGAIAALLFPIDQNLVASAEVNGAIREIRITKPILALGLTVAALYSAVIVFVVGRLRRVFATLTAGDPFHPDNIKRLRLIGLGLAALEAGNVLIPMGAAALMPGVGREGAGWPDLTAWFSVLVVFVLAEVFREGARLRREAELTI
jgi:hypothetical protein